MKRVVLATVLLPAACTSLAGESRHAYDVLIVDGTLHDGSGGPPIVADVALRGDRIVAIGELDESRAGRVIDARGLVVAPGFVNVLSWATESLIFDGRSQSDIRQGVTLEIFGEGESMGPLTPAMKEDLGDGLGEQHYEVEWTGLMEYLEWLERRGISPNVASFVGATTLRMHELGHADRAPTPAELARMEALLAEEMEQGALGLGSSLIYAPAFYAGTDELVALASVAPHHGGTYTTHLRSEGHRFLEAHEEALLIGREAGIGVEIYHLKAAGRENWPKQAQAIERIERARAGGQRVTADVYVYEAGATGLSAAMPPWVQEGGYDAWAARLRDPATRERVVREMGAPAEDWENLYLLAGGGENVQLVGFKNAALQPLTGRTVEEVARERGLGEPETMIDLVLEDESRVEAVYFLMSEADVRQKIALPWVSFCSDAASLAPEGDFLRAAPHPRAYGNFARLLGRYVRHENIIPLEEAIRRLTSFPCETFGISERGRIAEGFFADVCIFDPETIADHATYADPHRYATGVHHVFVNGEQVLADGEHTGALPGRVVRGRGWRGRDE